MIVDKEDQRHNDQSYRICVTKTGKLIMRNCKHLKVTPIESEQYLRDQLSKDKTTETLQDISKQFEATNLAVTKTSHDTQVAKRRASTQCDSRAEINSDDTLSPNTTNTQQIDIAVDSIINGELADSYKKGR